jgi:hypothetical protein
VGRLEDIVQRNKHPGRRRERFAVGMTSLVLLIVVGLLIFTVLQSGPVPAPPVPGAASGTRGVNDVKLYRAPASGSAKPTSPASPALPVTPAR